MSSGNERCLIAVDLDGTILKDLRTLDEGTARALKAAQDKGHVVMLSTARPSCMTLPFYREMGLTGPVTVLNGAYTYHPLDERFVRREDLLDAAEVGQVLSRLPHADTLGVLLQLDDTVHAYGDFPYLPFFMELLDKSSVTRHTSIADLPALPTGRIMVMLKNSAKGQQAAQEMAGLPGLFLYRREHPEGIYLNMRGADCDKWMGVHHAARQLGIDTKNIIAFGDEENDRQMVFNAGKGFVMRNAPLTLLKDALNGGYGVTEYIHQQSGVGHEINELLGLGINFDRPLEGR